MIWPTPIDDLRCDAIVGRMMLRRLASAIGAAALIAGVQLAGATPAAAAPRVLYYDA